MPNFDFGIKDVIQRSQGHTFWRFVTVTSSSIKSATKLAITTNATGRLWVKNIIVKTDGTGLAGGTNFEIGSTNLKGVANIFVETVANLGATATKVLNPGTSNADTTTADATPSVTALQTILEAGQHLYVDSTAAPCTGTGTIDIAMQFERAEDNAFLFSTGSTL